MPHAARQPRSWLIFDVRHQTFAMLASSDILRDAPPMKIGPFGASVVLIVASVARREGPAAKAASAGWLGALCIQSGKKTDAHPEARQRCSVKLAGACFAPLPRKSPNKAP